MKDKVSMIAQGDVQSVRTAPFAGLSVLTRFLFTVSSSSAWQISGREVIFVGSWLMARAPCRVRSPARRVSTCPLLSSGRQQNVDSGRQRLARLSILRTGTAVLAPSYRYPRLLDPYHSEPALCRAPLPRNPPIGDAFSQLRIAANTAHGTTLESSSRLPVTCTEIEDSARRGHTLATANAILLFLQ